MKLPLPPLIFKFVLFDFPSKLPYWKFASSHLTWQYIFDRCAVFKKYIQADDKMGGQPVGPGMFKAALAETPREAFNWRLVFSVICFGLMVKLLGSSPHSDANCVT